MGYKILLVDDSADLLNAYVGLLKISTTHDVRTAQSGRSALEIVRSWRPDVVVTDIIMPDMTGLDLISHICSDVPPPLPIIAAWSGFPDYEEEARRRGAQLFQPKPLDPDNLLLFIESALGKREPPARLRVNTMERRQAASRTAQVRLAETVERRPYFHEMTALYTRILSRYFGNADVALLVMEGGHMRVFAASDSSGAGIRLEGVLAYAINIIESGSTLILPDLSTMPANDSRVPLPDAQLFVAVPVRLDGITIGALALADRQPNSFDAHDLAILEHVGDKFATVLADDPSSRVPREPAILIKDTWRYCLRHEIEHVGPGHSLIVALTLLPPVRMHAIVATPEDRDAVKQSIEQVIGLLPSRAALGRLNPVTLAAFALVEDTEAGEQALRKLLSSFAAEPNNLSIAEIALSVLHPGDGGAAILEVAQWLLDAAVAQGPGTTLRARLFPERVAPSASGF